MPAALPSLTNPQEDKPEVTVPSRFLRYALSDSLNDSFSDSPADAPADCPE